MFCWHKLGQKRLTFYITGCIIQIMNLMKGERPMFRSLLNKWNNLNKLWCNLCNLGCFMLSICVTNNAGMKAV